MRCTIYGDVSVTTARHVMTYIHTYIPKIATKTIINLAFSTVLDYDRPARAPRSTERIIHVAPVPVPHDSLRCHPDANQCVYFEVYDIIPQSSDAVVGAV